MSIEVPELAYWKSLHKIEGGWNMTKEVMVPLTIPESWGMYTPAGNKAITTRAQKLVDKILKAETYGKKLDAISSFLKSYAKMSDTRNRREALDTDVRDGVLGFCENLCMCLGIQLNILNTIWEEDYE